MFVIAVKRYADSDDEDCEHRFSFDDGCVEVVPCAADSVTNTVNAEHKPSASAR